MADGLDSSQRVTSGSVLTSSCPGHLFCEKGLIIISFTGSPGRLNGTVRTKSFHCCFCQIGETLCELPEQAALQTGGNCMDMKSFAII